MKKNRILVLSWHPEPPYSGGSYNCIYKAFEQHAKDPSLVFEVIDKEGSQLSSLESSSLRLHEYHIPGYAKRVRSKSYALGRLLEWRYVMSAMKKMSTTIIANNEVSAIYLPIAENNQMTLVAKKLAKKYKLPVYALLHQYGTNEKQNYFAEISSIYKKDTGLARKLYSLLEASYVHVLANGLNRRLRSFKQVGSISESLSKKLEVILSRKILTIPYGFSSEDYIGTPRQNKKYEAVYLGRIVETKGMNDLLETWSIVTKKYSDAQLAIIGSGSNVYINDLKRQIKSRKLENNIVLLGQMEGQLKIKTLKQSKSFLFLSHLESHSDVVTEAIACDLPVIAYDLPAYHSRKQFTDHMYLFNRNDYRSIAAKVCDVMNQPRKVQSKSLNQLPSWKDFAKKEKEMLLENRILG